jgi:hypothetical protein
MEKLIEYGKSLGYDLRIVPNYIYLRYNNGYLVSTGSWRNFSEKDFLLARVLNSFYIQVKNGQLDQGGYWKNISEIQCSYGKFMVSSIGFGSSHKKIRRKIHSYLLQSNFESINISGVISQELDLGEYSKYNLGLDDRSSGVEIRLVNVKEKSFYKSFPLEFTYDFANIKRGGNEYDQVEWFDVDIYLVDSPFANKYSIYVPNLLEMGLNGWIRDKKLENLLLDNNI